MHKWSVLCICNTRNSRFLVDLQTGDLIPKEDDKLFEMME